MSGPPPPPQPIQPLHVAAASSASGRADAVRLCLNRGAAVDDPDGVGRTALWFSCWRGHVDVATILLGRGANVNQADEYGESPLYAASEKGHFDVATLLLDRGADVDRATSGGFRPLCVACRDGHIALVRLFLDRGAAANSVTLYGWTPLHMACAFGHADAALLCLQRGADVSLKNQYGETPRETASLSNRTVVVAWVARIQKTGWAAHLSEPRYKLVVLRGLVAQGRARREHAFHGKEQLLDLLFPGDQSRDQPRLPDDLFSIIARYCWDGGLSPEEETASTAENAAIAAAEGEYEPDDFLGGSDY